MANSPFIFSVAVILAATTAGCGEKPQTTPPTQARRLGMNLAGVAYWSPEIVFVDLFKQSQPWTSQMDGKPYGQGGPLAVNALGWVEKLNGNGHFAESLMCVDLEGHFPGGAYICLYDGDGEIDFGQAGKVLDRGKGRLTVKVTPADGPIALRLLKTDPTDPVRNIRFMLSDVGKNYQEQPFRPAFLKRWEDFKVIRFMDWGSTNNSKVASWTDRSTPARATQATEKGVALEYQIQLANAQNADPWFCIPHLADDNYVREFAKLVKADLKSDRKIYLEYSNECWHGGFEGGRHCADRGQALGLSKDRYEGQLRYYTRRSLEIFKIVEEIFGGTDRLVRVLSTSPDGAWGVNTVLDWNDAAKKVDAIAIAPYFGNNLGKPDVANKTSTMSVEHLLDVCKTEIAANAKRTKEVAKVVKDRGLKLIAYEGGQHLVGVDGAENNEKLAKLFQAANRSSRMKNLYLEDLANWEQAGGGLFCVFNSMGRYSKWGSWGVLEFGDQDEKAAPKLEAVREFMRK